ncbi:protein-L-isoaspartate O-methyltransferase, partial [bacterium]|nr:protein-L-isoaspartate O-methyltransferase [bacterium]
METLIQQLISEGYLKTPEIIKAFREIDRKDFVPSYLKKEAYINAPLPIGFGQTISQPLTVAFMLELLQPKRGDKILDIGSGSGWTTALLAYIVGQKDRFDAQSQR